MVLFYSHVHIFQSPWEDCVLAWWNKYPNSFSCHVKTVDIISRNFDAKTGILTYRTFSSAKLNTPRWLFTFGFTNYAYSIEDTIIDPYNKTLTTIKQNITLSSICRAKETCILRPYSAADMLHIAKLNELSKGNEQSEEYQIEKRSTNVSEIIGNLENEIDGGYEGYTICEEYVSVYAYMPFVYSYAEDYAMRLRKQSIPRGIAAAEILLQKMKNGVQELQKLLLLRLQTVDVMNHYCSATR